MEYGREFRDMNGIEQILSIQKMPTKVSKAAIRKRRGEFKMLDGYRGITQRLYRLCHVLSDVFVTAKIIDAPPGGPNTSSFERFSRQG